MINHLELGLLECLEKSFQHLDHAYDISKDLDVIMAKTFIIKKLRLRYYKNHTFGYGCSQILLMYGYKKPYDL